MDLRHERNYGSDSEDRTHLPQRSKSIRREPEGGEGSMVDVFESRSIPFRPRRANVGGYQGREIIQHKGWDEPRGRERRLDGDMRSRRVVERRRKMRSPDTR